MVFEPAGNAPGIETGCWANNRPATTRIATSTLPRLCTVFSLAGNVPPVGVESVNAIADVPRDLAPSEVPGDTQGADGDDVKFKGLH
jgi:hypothetical protein